MWALQKLAASPKGPEAWGSQKLQPLHCSAHAGQPFLHSSGQPSPPPVISGEIVVKSPPGSVGGPRYSADVSCSSVVVVLGLFQ